MSSNPPLLSTTRRHFLAGAGSVVGGMGAAKLIAVSPALATPETLASAIRNVTGGDALQPGKVKLEIPPLVENGNAVGVTVSVDSAMTASDHVRRIALFNEKNPQADVIVFQLSPRAGRARVATRIRLATSQMVVAVAELSDGTFWSSQGSVIVTLAACIEDLS